MLPQIFNQLYAFHYAFLSAHGREDIVSVNLPWRGGYRVISFYKILQHRLQKPARPVVRAVRYASPGATDISLIVEAARQIGEVVGIAVAAAGGVYALYDKIHKECSKRELLRIEVDRRKRALKKEDLDFAIYASEQLAKIIGFERLSDVNGITGEDAINTLKIIMSYHRRLNVLVEYEQDGKAHFPKSGSRRQSDA